MVDTALLIAGALTASMYFNANTPDEIELRELADALYCRIDWHWAQNSGATITQGWKPECGFLHYGWEGYNEAILLYVLALGSPTHPLGDDGYQSLDRDLSVGKYLRLRSPLCGSAFCSPVLARLD